MHSEPTRMISRPVVVVADYPTNPQALLFLDCLWLQGPDSEDFVVKNTLPDSFLHSSVYKIYPLLQLDSQLP